MPRANKRKFYAVRVGRTPGIYYDWESAQKQTIGYPGALHQAFTIEADAIAYLERPIDRWGGKAAASKAKPRPSTSPYSLRSSPTRTPTVSTMSTPLRATASATASSSPVSKRPDVIDMSFESDGDSVVDMTLDSSDDDMGDIVQLRQSHAPRRPYVKRERKSARYDTPPPDMLDALDISDEDAADAARVETEVDLFYANPYKYVHLAHPNVEAAGAADASDDGVDPPLSEQQQEVLQRCLQGANIFFTGSAGTGKSVLLRALIKALKNKPGGGEVAVTASTGMAALNIGGCTLHSWAGIGLGTGTPERLVRYMSSFARKRWHRTDTLVVDEVSMLHGDLLDKLDTVGRKIRGQPSVPFGGIQIIFCGDFLQLPPVSKGGPVSFAFDSNVWDKLFPRSNFITLQNVFRQSDQTFVKCLESVRRGDVTWDHDVLLTSLERPLDQSDGIQPVRLHSRRADVEFENMNNLNALESRIEQYDSEDRGFVNERGHKITEQEATEMLNERSRWPQHLPLKVGAQVMLVTNWMPGLVNGSTGKVTAFMTVEEGLNAGIFVPPDAAKAIPKRKWPVVQFNPHRNSPHYYPEILVPQMTMTIENANQAVEAMREQVPMILAWAITIHKSQGLTLEKVRVDLKGAFDCGQAYVALSRATCLEGLEVRNYSRSKIMTSQRVLAWMDEMAEDEEWDKMIAGSQVVLDY